MRFPSQMENNPRIVIESLKPSPNKINKKQYKNEIRVL